MDDHVHAVVLPCVGESLSSVLHTWKSYSANRLQRLHGREGSIWQDESLDRGVRSRRAFDRMAEYILSNPTRRWPEIETYEYSGWGTLRP